MEQNNTSLTVQDNRKGKITSWIYFIVSIIYCISSIDLVPDMPIVGWFDDLFIFLSASVNLFQQHFTQANTYLYNFCRILKYILFALALIVFLLFVLVIILVMSID